MKTVGLIWGVVWPLFKVVATFLIFAFGFIAAIDDRYSEASMWFAILAVTILSDVYDEIRKQRRTESVSIIINNSANADDVEKAVLNGLSRRYDKRA